MGSSNNQFTDQSYWGIVKRQFQKNRLAVYSLRFVIVIFIVGIFADFIANEKPYYCKINGETHFPLFKSYGVALGITKYPSQLINIQWWDTEFESELRPPIPYSPQNMDSKNNDYKGPFDTQNTKGLRWRHWLGTDNLGRDVLSGMIHGTRTAMLVGIISMSISALIGILLGALAGYYGDHGLQVSRGRFWVILFSIFIAFWFAFVVRIYDLKTSLSIGLGSFFLNLLFSLIIFGLIIFIGVTSSKLLDNITWLAVKIDIPVDLIISRLIEIKVSIPTLLLILAIVAVMKSPSIFIVMVIIGFTTWTGIAKYTRAELLRVRSLEYIQAAQALGFGEARTIFKHALPNALAPVLVAIAFGVAAAILIESNLSFLGIGVRPEDVTWGSMITGARSHFKAWWLAIIPGFAIFITVTIFNLLGEGLTDAMDPKLKQ